MYLRTEKILKFWKKWFKKAAWSAVLFCVSLIILFANVRYSNSFLFHFSFIILFFLVIGVYSSYFIKRRIKLDMKIEPEDNVTLLRFFNFIHEWRERKNIIYLGKKNTELMKELKGYSFKHKLTGFGLLFYSKLLPGYLLIVSVGIGISYILGFPGYIKKILLLISLSVYLVWAYYSVLFIFNSKKVYYSPLENSNPHSVIAGVSGSGKSALLRAIISDMILKIKKPVLIIDFHNEFIDEVEKLGGKVYHMNEISINVFELTDSPRRHISMLISMIHSIVPLGQIQQFTLENILYEMYKERGIVEEDPRTWTKVVFTSSDLMEVLMQKLKNAKDKKTNDSLIGIYRRLDNLFGSNIFGSKSDIPFSKIIDESSVIALAQVSNEQTQKFITEFLLRRLYFYMLSTKKIRNQVRLFVALDEAAKIIPHTGSIVENISAEARKYGIALVLASQSLTSLNQNIIHNSSFKATFHSSEIVELEYSIKTFASSIDDHLQSDKRRNIVADMIRYLNPLQFIFINSVHKNPIKVNLTPPWKRKYLIRIMSGEEKGFNFKKFIDYFKKKETPVLETSKDPEKKPESFIESIKPQKDEAPNKVVVDTILRKIQLNNGCVQKTALLDSMKMSVRLFYDVLGQMKEAGLIEEVTINLTEKKKAIYVVRKHPNKSPIHFTYIAVISEHLQKKNYGFSIEDKANTPDLEVSVAGENIALEVEMGKKKDLQELYNMLTRRLKDYNRIIIVTPSENIEKMKNLVDQMKKSEDIFVMNLEDFFRFFK